MPGRTKRFADPSRPTGRAISPVLSRQSNPCRRIRAIRVASSTGAGLLLTVGRAEEASALIDRALAIDQANSQAFAVQSVIAVTRNEKERALALAQKAVALDGRSPSARVALSYAQQAFFDVKGARTSLEEAVSFAPENALAWARLSELWLSSKYVGKALDAAQRALDLNPRLARTQTVLGFARLVQIEIGAAKEAFKKAIRLDQADPLPRLGLGLAKIRDGKLKEGRSEIEIAVSLDPNNSLLRSYLGKAYFEEKREKQASEQFRIAKELDPMDPTPWFYDAIQKQTLNRPVEAIEDLQKSMALNNNRAVYRSRLLLDEDLAARGVSLARVYDDLGFQWLALSEGWKSLETDPANHSAHRFLADSFFSLPRHEIARVSELLQSQLLQPVNILPIQPQLAESRTFFGGGAGPRDASYNEYTSLFERDRLSLLLGGVGGERGTFSDEVVQSGTVGRYSYSVGQFHSETDGFRPNNWERSNIYQAFTQASITPRTSVQAEYRHSEFRSGDLYAFFDPQAFSLLSNDQNRGDQFRFGVHHSFAPQSDLIGSFMYGTRKADSYVAYPDRFPYDYKEDASGYGVELQHIYRAERFSLIAGFGYFDTDSNRTFTLFDFPVPGMNFESPSKPDVSHTNFYLYSHLNFPANVTWTLGVSVDWFKGGAYELDTRQPNPKLGVTWTPFPGTTLRGAVFRTLKRTLLTNQTVEPTHVAGFNQFFDDGEGTDAWRYGVGLDQKLSEHLFAGVEYSWRDLDIPFQEASPGLPVSTRDGHERLGRAYLYWAPHPWFSVGPEYQYERFEYSPDLPIGNLLTLDTHRVGLGVGFYHPRGIFARVRPTFVVQTGDIWDHNLQLAHADSNFVTLDASIGYRLPKRLGLIEIEARNLFDEGFRFQDTWPQNPRITPGRCILTRWTLSF